MVSRDINTGVRTLSLYGGVLAEDKPVETATCIGRLTVAFGLAKDFTDLLTERVCANHFTIARLTDAVNYMIDHYKYGYRFSVSDIINYDKKVTLYTYDEYTDHPTGKAAIRVNDTLMWVDVQECRKYGLKVDTINRKLVRV